MPAPLTAVVYCAGRKIPGEILAETRMFSRSCLALLLGLAAAWAQPTTPQTQAGAQPAIPETPAGRTLKAWLEALNSGDRALLDAYLHRYDPSKSLDNERFGVRTALLRGLRKEGATRRRLKGREVPAMPSRKWQCPISDRGYA
jgi:hypothetical protein